MSPKVEWRNNDMPADYPAAGWALEVNDRFEGFVWLDGSYTVRRFPLVSVNCGSQPLAAQALLRAAGVER